MTAAILLAAATAAGAQELGPEIPFAPAPLGAAQTEDVPAGLVPSGAGWLAFFQRGKTIRAMRIDPNGEPDYRTKPVVEDVEAYSFAVAGTDRGLLAVWRRGDALFVAPLGADGVPSQPGRILVAKAYGSRLTCGPSRCLVSYWHEGPSMSTAIVDSSGSGIGRADLPVGWVLASAADPDGFLLVMTDTHQATRGVRLGLDGRRISETAISEEPFLYAAADFDGELFVIVTASAWNGPVRAVAMSPEGEIGASRVVYTPGPNIYTPGPSVRYLGLSIAWSGTQHLVTIVDDESGVPVPSDTPIPSKIFAIPVARDLVTSGDRAPIALGADTYSSFFPFTAANGGSFFVAWIARNGGAVVRGVRIGPNGVAFTRHVLTLRPLDQQPAALAVGSAGPVAVWSESDALAGRTAIRVGLAGSGAAQTAGEAPYIWMARAAALDDEALAVWYAPAGNGSTVCCTTAAAVVTGSKTIPVATDSLLFEPHVAAGRRRWMIVGYSREGIGALLVGRDGQLVTPEPIVVARIKEARRYDVASDGETFLVVSMSYGEAGVTATLVDEDGRILRSARIANSGEMPAVAWNGREYAVAVVSDGGVIFVHVGPDGTARGTPMFYPTNDPWAYVTSLAPFGHDWLMTLRTSTDSRLVHLSADFEELSVDRGRNVAAVASGPDGRAYALSSVPYEPAPYPTSMRAVAREVAAPTLLRAAP